MKGKISKISVAGLGKLGLPLMAAIAKKGYAVSGYDCDERKLDAYRRGEFPFETGLEDLVTRYRFRMRFTHDLLDLCESGITFFVVPTPSLPNGAFSNAYLEKALTAFGTTVLKKKKGFHILSIVSTVIPGSMEHLKTLLEKASGKKCGQDFGLCYNPAFIALGNVIKNFLQPDFILIGESDPKTGEILEYFYRHFAHRKAAIHRMNFINAEIAKISLNTFVTMKISFGNTLARICEKISQADALAVTRAIGDDRRIGRAYLQGAVGYGGPCFPRDNRAFSYFAEQTGSRALSSEATDRINQSQVDALAQMIMKHAGSKKRIGILGLSYKPDTDVIEESQGVALAAQLSKKGYKVSVFDPASLENAKRVLKNKVRYAVTAETCVQDADVVMFVTAWASFKAISLKAFQRPKGKTLIALDCWRIFNGKKWPASVCYIPLGVGQGSFPKTSKKGKR